MQIIIEKGNDGFLWGRVEVPEGDYLPATVGKNTAEIVANIKMLVIDHQKTDGDEVKFFTNEDFIKINLVYDIQALFVEFSFLKISEIAKEADMNPGLVRQYASGVKHLSAKQAEKMEQTIHRLAQKMLDLSLL